VRGSGETPFERASQGGDVCDEVLTCPVCGWQITWGEYALSFRRKQLHYGGATAAFEAYVRAYGRVRPPRLKMLAIDQLIHEFHYSLRQQPDLPCRPVGVNLIQGKASDVVRFLDELTYGEQTPPEMEDTRAEWQARIQETYWRDLVDVDGGSGSG
jgi:hypothetical protein